MDSLFGTIPLLALAVLIVVFCSGAWSDDDDGGCDGGDGGD